MTIIEWRPRRFMHEGAPEEMATVDGLQRGGLPASRAARRAAIPHARLLALVPAKHLGLIEHQAKYADAVCEFGRAAQVQVKRVGGDVNRCRRLRSSQRLVSAPKNLE